MKVFRCEGLSKKGLPCHETEVINNFLDTANINFLPMLSQNFLDTNDFENPIKTSTALILEEGVLIDHSKTNVYPIFLEKTKVTLVDNPF